MICNSCGRSLKDTAKFCSGCGSLITSSYAESNVAVDFSESLQPRVSALFTDEPTSQPTQVECATHSAAIAAGKCVRCGNFYCRDCLTNNGYGNVCRHCSEVDRTSRAQSVPLYQDSPVNSSLAVATVPQAQPYPQAAPNYRFAGLSPYYQQEFSQIAASGELYKGRWNWAAFFFGGLWALTKGAWATFLVTFAINLVFIGVTCGWGSPIIFVFPIIYGLRGNYIYYSVVTKNKQVVF